MKHIRLAGLAFAFSLATASVSLAQQPAQQHEGHREHAAQGERRGPRGGFKAFFKDIKLTDAQKAQLKQLNQKEREQFRASGERRDTAQFRVRREQRFAAIRSILTADQQRQFDKNVAEMQKKFAERRARHQAKKGA